MSSSETIENTQENEEYSLELSHLSILENFINSYASGAGLASVSLKDLHNMLRNPYKNIKKIQNTARYFSNRYGIVKDVNEAFKTLPSLNYHLVWSNYDNPQKITKYEKKVYELLDKINVKKVIRDGLGQEAEVGTVVAVNRKNKYIQFLDLDKVRLDTQVNGKWIPEIDLSTISGTVKEIIAQINSLPDEVTIEKYNKYKNNNSEENRYVQINNAYVLSIRGERNFPYGFPYTLPSWSSLLHRTLIEQVEKSVADRKIKSLLVLYVQSIAKKEEGFKPPNKDVINAYFNELTKLMKKKDKSGSLGDETAGTGVMTLPAFFDLKEIELDTEMFSKEVYDKLDRDIYANLGVSEAMINGGGTSSNYGTSQMNSEKFFRYIFSAIEEWEYMINEIISKMLPADLNCKFYVDRTTISDKEKDINAKKEFYMQTGVWIPWAESLLNVPYTYALGIAEYQQKVLKIHELIKPPQNAYTQSGNNGAGRPENELVDNKDSNIQSKGNGGNQIPSPSD